jgi:Ca-activated chloride channel family protein
MYAHESLMVAMPQTSMGWQLQFLIGIALLLLGLTLVKVSDSTSLAKRPLKG